MINEFTRNYASIPAEGIDVTVWPDDPTVPSVFADWIQLPGSVGTSVTFITREGEETTLTSTASLNTWVARVRRLVSSTGPVNIGTGTPPIQATSGSLAYTPTDTNDWPGADPDDPADALDKLADRTHTTLSSVLTAGATLVVRQITKCNTTGGGFTCPLPSVASLNPDDFITVDVVAGTAGVVLDPAGSETVREVSTYTVTDTVTLIPDPPTNWLSYPREQP